MPENTIQSQAFKLKGRLYTFTVLQILDSDPQSFKEQLVETIAKAPKMLEKAPVVLDFSSCREEKGLQEIIELIRAQGLIPVAVQGASPLIDTLAQCSGLAVLNASKTQDRPIIEKQDPTPGPGFQSAKIINTPVRSGQQVVAKGSDLIITASVSNGAELLADGNIHVYGALRGRALAGMSGDLSARIFCQSLDADLISIAGYYRLNDSAMVYNKPCQIYLQDEQIQIGLL